NPPQTLTPAQEPVAVDEENPHQIEGDRTRPRWSTSYDPAQVMRTWEAISEVAEGTLDHGADGRATLEIPSLKPGAYRLIYSTEDAFGTPYETQQSFLIAHPADTRVALPAFLAAEQPNVAVGGTARLFVHSGFHGQVMVLELYRQNQRFDRRIIRSGRDSEIIEIPVDQTLRGGFGATLTVLHDHQLITSNAQVFVPWDDRKLKLEFATFRDRLRPGQKETFRVTVRSAEGDSLDSEAAEVLASMYDRSLDLFAPYNPPTVDHLYPSLVAFASAHSTLGSARAAWQDENGFVLVPSAPSLGRDRLRMLDGYGIGGPGRRGGRFLAMKAGAMREMAVAAPAPAEMEMADAIEVNAEVTESTAFDDETGEGRSPADQAPAAEVRSNFAETAFFSPHLVPSEDGSVVIEFETPDSVTEWNLWVHAVTRDLRGASEERQVKTVKELMVRPAVPRFLREGDDAALRVVVNNAGEEPLEGTLRLELYDPDTDEDLRPAFAIDHNQADATPFTVEPGQGTTLSFPFKVPPRPGLIAFKVTATAGDFSDGEIRPLPVLPGRMHLLQSRFAALRDDDRRELFFPDMSADDPTLIHDQLVVSVDAQLFYGVLDALPYLIDYPYECTEQTLNRFLSTGIVTSVFDRYPAVAKMAETMAERDTRLESWDADDPNRKLALEETPWLARSRGGDEDAEDLIKVLDPSIADAQRRASLADLEKVQTSLGAFPWWPGGPPSPYMTLYVLAGFAHALEFEVDVPKDVIVEAWAYMHRHYLDDIAERMVEKGCCWETITWLNFVLSSYPDESWTGGVFTPDDRERMLNFSFSHWKRHSPRLKAYLAMTLKRAGRDSDAGLVWDSVMDSARTDRDLGTFWAPEERAWLWYNDTVETHAVALRALTELDPDDDRRLGLVQWIYLNKKLNHWESTRTTAEVVYALVHYLEYEGQLGQREEATVTVGPITRHFIFEPESFTGKDARVVIPGPEVDPKTMATTIVEKHTPGIAFATATWHFSTEKLPEKGDGDLFSVERTFYRRKLVDAEYVLEPMASGTTLEVGDQLEVELRISARHEAEYVHLRSPRGAGFEPEALRSGWRWDLGVAAYEEVRDSGSNLFFEWLPAGEYTFRYRLRATMAGTFKVAPAVLQSMYAPEFGAYSAGHTLTIEDS
ncbi:MAG: alpha-2-macroglobulin family protein, partial [Acidobacteriota bacterium]